MNIPVYRRRTSKSLLSFNDNIREVPVCGKELVNRQNDAFSANALPLPLDIPHGKEISEPAYIEFDDDLFFTSAFVKEVIKAIANAECSLVFGLEDNCFNKRYVLPHSENKDENLFFAFYYMTGNKDEIRQHPVKQVLYPFSYRLPPQLIPHEEYEFYRSDCFITRIASPFHLLQANLAFNVIRTIKPERIFPGSIIRRFGNPGSRFYYLALKRMNRIGRNCKIHPTAVIEASVLGDNVTVEANAVVRFSYIGSGTSIADNVVVINSVLHNNNLIANCNYISSSLLFDNVFLIHGPYQFSVFGNRSAVFAVINCDIRLDQAYIRIPTDRGLLDSGQHLMGIAYGHNSKIAGGNIIAAGRIVPNNYIMDPPDNIVLSFD